MEKNDKNMSEKLSDEWLNTATTEDWAVPPTQRAVFIRGFANAILHGSDLHKQWLLEAAEAYIKGDPLPPPKQ